MSTKLESYLPNYPKPISYKRLKTIKEQMEKCVCKIKLIDKENTTVQATGFFTLIKIPKKEKKIPVLITCNHTHEINLKGNETFSLDIQSAKDTIKINLKDRRFYTNRELYDTTIIELKEDDGINNFLELDEEWNNNKYIDQTLYILHYPNGELSASFGLLKSIYEDKPYNFQHLCCTLTGSSGGLIVKEDNKLIGIHKEGCDKYNIGTFLNYPIEKFIQKYYDKKIVINKDNNEKLLMNNIEDDSKEKNLSDQNINDEKLKYLSKKKYPNLEQLILASNNIKNIEPLINIKFDKLQILDLKNNKISDIKPLGKIGFPKLTSLNLMKNNISDISILEKMNSIELKELLLNNNEIKDIKVLEKVKCPKLEILNLNSNQISDINILSKVNFQELKELYLSNNKISNITIFERVNFPNLELLSLKENKISDINILAKVNFQKLRRILLDNNKISDIKVLSKIDMNKFVKLNTISLSNNDIDKQKISFLNENIKERLII